MTIPMTDPDRENPNEYSEVEYPMLSQLAGMGWEYLQGDLDYPQKTFREHFREVILKPRLRAAIRKINLDDNGNEYLDDVTIDRAIQELQRTETQNLLDRNKELTAKLVLGVKVPWAECPAGARDNTVRVHFFDFDRWDRNDFLAINQFRVEFIGRTGFVIPDIVLFVNGIPLAVIECKSPAIIEPMNEGINQLLRYSNQRQEVAEDEGVPHLFLFNQIMVSTWFYEARAAALGAEYEYYQEWKDTVPVPLEHVAAELDKTTEQLKSQEILAAGMLRPAHLLDILRNFVLFGDDNGKLVKIVPRYQQFRAVHKTIERLAKGRTRIQSGDTDERGGVVWHTQGSGKSITMVFLVRKMRTTDGLKDFKIVLVTDRTQLEKQLRETMGMSGQNIRPNQHDRGRQESPSDRVQRILKEEGPDLVFCMIQKNQDYDAPYEVLEFEIPLPLPRAAEGHVDYPGGEVTPEDEKLPVEEAPANDAPTEPTVYRQTRRLTQRIPTGEPTFPPLNESEKVLLLVDEAHRDNAGTLHANLMSGLPNAAKIAFTGTPIFRKERTNTFRIFGPLIDQYGMKESVADEATVKILYEGRIPEGLVERAAELDKVARWKFRAYNDAEFQIIMNLYATEPRVLEAPELIAAKADDMLRHYVRDILPEGFKAQVVATSRLAAIRYQKSLQDAKDKLVAELEALTPATLQLSEAEVAQLEEAQQYLIGVHRQLARIKELEFAAVISHAHNDPPSYRTWSEPDKRDDYEARFKLPFEHENPQKRSGMAFLCVQNMLLTGFDAPVEQVIYIDRRIREHVLLQAIARVNRKKRGKQRGYVVDYIGIGKFLKEALLETEGGGDGGGLDTKREEIPRLEDRYRQVMAIFTSAGIADITDIQACVDLLKDVKVRADFIKKLRLFLISLGIVLPLPEGNRYLRDAKILGFIAKVAANLYRDNQLNLLGVEKKVRQLIDEYISAQGVDPKIPPIDIMDAGFEAHVKGKKTAKSRASEMLHAMRFHITIHMDEDPEHYKTLSQKLEEIFQNLRDNWDEMEKVLREFMNRQLLRGRQEAVAGINPTVQAPFFDMLKKAAEDEAGAGVKLKPEDPAFPELVQLTVKTVGQIQGEICKVDFWRDPPSRQALEQTVNNELRWCRVTGRRVFQNTRELATRIVDLAYRRRRFLVE